MPGLSRENQPRCVSRTDYNIVSVRAESARLLPANGFADLAVSRSLDVGYIRLCSYCICVARTVSVFLQSLWSRFVSATKQLERSPIEDTFTFTASTFRIL